nr:retrovirus-related Pol polyprotein from transposon TNT 1-94 [Tanacetum cinerariifolium]
MRIEYSQWRKWFMNYLEEQTDGKAMINSIRNEKKTRKIDRLAISLLIQGLPNEIYSLIDSNENAKDLWDALKRQMCGSKYDEQDRRAVILYKYETFEDNEGEQLLDTYLHYLQEDKKADEKKRDMSKIKCYNCKKERHFAKDCKKAKVLSDSDKSSSSAEETIVEVSYYTSESESESEFETSKYYDNSTNYGLFMNNDDDQEIFHDAIESASKNFIEYHIDSQKDYNKSKVDHNDSKEKEHLADKLIRKFNHKIAKCQKRIGFENPSYFEKAKDLRPTLYDEKVIGLGYTPMFLTHSDKALEIEKFKRSRENKIEFAYDYGNLNQTNSLKPYVPTMILEKIIIDLEDEVVSLMEKEKANLKTIESLKSKGCESNENTISESKNQSENDCHMFEKECDKVENSKVIAPGMFKLSASQSVSPISMSKTSCDSKNIENTFSSVRRPKHSDVIWKKKGSSNTSNVDLSSVSLLKLNKNVKRYSCKDLFSCNNSHLGETSSAYMCNDAMNVSCNSRMCDLFDDNNFFIFDDESVRISLVSKMPFKKKPYSPDLSLDHRFGMFKAYDGRNRTLVEAARTMLTFANLPLFLSAEAIATACFTQNHLIIHKRFDKTPYELMNKRKPNIKFFRVFGCRCYLLNDYENVGKLKAKGDIGVFVGYSKESAAFRIFNKRTRKTHETVNVNFDEISEMATKQFSLELGLSNLNEKGKSSNLLVSQIMKSSTTNVETSINEEIFHEVSESFQGESSSSSLNDDVQQSPEEVILPQINTQSILINMIPNGDEASTSYNVFNKQLEDAYFDASTSFHDLSNVSESFQGESSSSSLNDDVQQSPEEVILPQINTQSLLINMIPNGDEASTSYNVFNKQLEDAYFDASTSFHDFQLANSYLLSFIEPAKVAEALKDDDWLVALNKKPLIMTAFEPVARIEAIRLFLAYAAHKDFTKWMLRHRFSMEFLKRKCMLVNLQVKNKRENDKIRTKPDKNRNRGKAGKSLKQLQ